MISGKELAFFGIIIAFSLAISLSALALNNSNPFLLFIRLLALNGFIALSIATIMMTFLKEITIYLKKPFTKVHHYFAAVGLVLITSHPIAVAIQSANPSIILPNFTSIENFFLYGGSIALISIYFAFGSVLIRRKIAKYWRTFHMLMYLALFFGIIHANLFGQDLLGNWGFKIVYDSLFAASLFVFVLKRWQFYQLKQGTKQV